ncbi:MAG: hypothetical protein CMF25_05815 [Kangiellaceae bacterium]|jgi:hypothetical protein|nr:hypothetical protein [Kangiellaceae bacterium]|tara:strand:+ start:117 stop:935 length:819 start_codon:yes stop_codon:yes gene_type:complete
MVRIRAFSIHLLISLSIVCSFFILVYFVWYTPPFRELEGVSNVVALLVSIDLILGPLLTLIIYVPGKKGLKFDLFVIALVQLSAFSYGAYTIYIERPAFVVFNVDRFNVVTAGSIEIDELSDPQLAPSVFESARFVYAQTPTDPGERFEIMVSATQGGKDLALRPKYYQSYSENAAKVQEQAIITTQLLEDLHPEASGSIAEILANHGIKGKALAYFPLVGKQKSMTAIIRRDNAEVIGWLDIDPWTLQVKAKKVLKQENEVTSKLSAPEAG